MSTRPMAQNYDPQTGVSLMGACDPSCRFPCAPTCPLDSERSVRAVFGPAGLEFDMTDSWSAFTCTCDRRDQHGNSDCRADEAARDLADRTTRSAPTTAAGDDGEGVGA